MLLISEMNLGLVSSVATLKIHLRGKHEMELVTKLLLRGKAFDMDYRTAFIIAIIKRRTPPDFYDHRTAKFVSLHRSEMLKESP
jgi:hypothetical protein